MWASYYIDRFCYFKPKKMYILYDNNSTNSNCKFKLPLLTWFTRCKGAGKKILELFFGK